MSQKTPILTSLNKRQVSLLQLFLYKESYSISDLDKGISSKATLKRDISTLENLGYIVSSGELKSTTYTLTDFGLVHRPFDVREYFLKTEQEKVALTQYNFEIWYTLSKIPVLNTEEILTLERATKKFKQNAEHLSEIVYKKELERFVIELAWKSSKIEGNTHSLLDTEKLIKDGVEAEGHTKEEAVMILNHKKAFSLILESQKDHSYIFSRKGLEEIHRLLVDDLDVGIGLRKTGVGITGSVYKPISVSSQIEEQLQALIDCINVQKDFYAKALIALLGISYLQPFEDGNKRTARLFANALLLLSGHALLSYRNVDEKDYKEAMLLFYEQNSIEVFKEIFMSQYVFSAENYNLARI
jgi:Fic family protein